MIKVTVKGETYPFDNEHYPLAEAIELEAGLGMTFGDWDRALASGSARAAAGLAWLALKRNGREVPLADILSGAYALEIGDIGAEAEKPPGPTPPAASPEGSGNGSPPSPSTTTSPPPMSVPSPSPSSTP